MLNCIKASLACQPEPPPCHLTFPIDSKVFEEWGMRVSPLPPNIWSTPQPWIPNHRIQEEEPDLMIFAMICHHFFELDMISTSGPSSATTALKSPYVCKRSPLLHIWSFVIVFHLWMDVVALAHLLLLQSLKVTLISKYEFWIPS